MNRFQTIYCNYLNQFDVLNKILKILVVNPNIAFNTNQFCVSAMLSGSLIMNLT